MISPGYTTISLNKQVLIMDNKKNSKKNFFEAKESALSHRPSTPSNAYEVMIKSKIVNNLALLQWIDYSLMSTSIHRKMNEIILNRISNSL